MARTPRVDVAGYAYHITQRGNNRNDCFFDDEDYQFYLDCLLHSAEKYTINIHAYVLMTNHVHLLITPQADGAMSRFIQHVGRKYVRYINDRYARSGTLWEGRYHSEVVDVEKYLLACYRYIELNPVRAGLVDRPSEYKWSSARWHGLGQENRLIRDHALYNQLGQDLETRCRRYRELFVLRTLVGSE